MMTFWLLLFLCWVVWVLTRTDDRCLLETQNEPFLQQLRAHTDRLVRALDPDDPRTQRIARQWTGRIDEMEHSENRRAFAYNVNKGQRIAVCLHNRRGELNPFNETFFVVLHELAHVATDAYAHNREFWDAFRWLLRNATKAGLYRAVDYAQQPVAFCEHRLDTSPLF